MSNYEKSVQVLEGPWEAKTFPKGRENTNVISRKTITTYNLIIEHREVGHPIVVLRKI